MRLFIRLAVFLCITPLRSARSTRPWVTGRSWVASALLPLAMTLRNFFTAVFRVDRLARLRSRAWTSRRAFLAADLWLAIRHSCTRSLREREGQSYRKAPQGQGQKVA